MTLSSALRTKNARSKNFRNHFILLCVLTPVLAAVCVLLGVFTSPANPVFIAILVLSAVFFTIGTAYCTMEYRSLVRFSRLCADEKYPCVFLSEYKNLEFFAADEESVRAYAELELKAYTALYKESGRHGARPVSDAERKSLKEQEKAQLAKTGKPYVYADFGAEDAPLLKNKTVFVSENVHAHLAKAVNFDALAENGNTLVLLKNPKIAK